MPAKTLHFQSPRHLSQLYAGKEENLAHAERALGVKLVTREDWLKIEAPQEPLALAEEFFAFLNAARSQGMTIRTPDFARVVDSFAKGEAGRWQALLDEPLVIATNRKSVVPKTIGQKEYLQSVLKKPIVFGIGPAGTGKTYLAMAAAVSALLNHEVKRIVLTRPAVEAGEALGFLPGDLREKILPYLRPLYDALHDMLDPEEVVKLTENRQECYLAPFSIRGTQMVGPKVGAELRTKAVLATLYALAGMLVYIAFRFEWIYGLGAVIACFHDTIITIGLFSMFNKEISMTVIAALLTLVGYSMNDTIVIFDRIRENLKFSRREPLEAVMNRAVNQTLSRTVMTSGLTFLTVIALFLFGGPVLNGFSFALVCGIIVGTYSSVFVASPIVLFWHNYADKRTRRTAPVLAPAGRAAGASETVRKGSTKAAR